MDQGTCPFCTLTPERIIDADEWAVVIRDGFPVAPGHTLVIPRRHIGSFFDLTDAERASVLGLLQRAHAHLKAQGLIGDCNIGVNDGAAAGQTVPHCHMHLIPREPGDVDDPRGGVRWVIPGKAKYWT
jgi:diadenosine tetraphosphate (Ap4A) HIT family hydrolase